MMKEIQISVQFSPLVMLIFLRTTFETSGSLCEGFRDSFPNPAQFQWMIRKGRIVGTFKVAPYSFFDRA